MSSCLSGGGGAAGRTYGFDLDLVKPPSPASGRSSHSSSSPSSTISESSNSPIAISTKRSRAPRKRPNQTLNEAAALLSTIYPNVFSSTTTTTATKFLTLRKQCKHPIPFDSFVESSDSFLIRDPSPEKPGFRIEPKVLNCTPSIGFRLPGSPEPLEDDFDTESILDEETGEGIDSIMGNNLNNNDDNAIEAQVNPILGSLMGFGFGGKFHHGLGFGFNENFRRALKKGDDWEWWRSPRVAVRDIVPKLKPISAASSPPPLMSKKKKKKKVEKEEGSNLPAAAATAGAGAADTIATTPRPTSLEELKQSGLGLKLNYEEVIKECSGHGWSPFGEPGSPESSAADVLVCFCTHFR